MNLNENLFSSNILREVLLQAKNYELVSYKLIINVNFQNIMTPVWQTICLDENKKKVLYDVLAIPAQQELAIQKIKYSKEAEDKNCFWACGKYFEVSKTEYATSFRVFDLLLEPEKIASILYFYDIMDSEIYTAKLCSVVGKTPMFLCQNMEDLDDCISLPVCFDDFIRIMTPEKYFEQVIEGERFLLNDTPIEAKLDKYGIITFVNKEKSRVLCN